MEWSYCYLCEADYFPVNACPKAVYSSYTKICIFILLRMVFFNYLFLHSMMWSICKTIKVTHFDSLAFYCC